jgi:hypothetical protein
VVSRSGKVIRVWVTSSEDGELFVSLEPTPNAVVHYASIPSDESVLLEIFSAVATNIRFAANVDNNKDAVRVLRERLTQARRKAPEPPPLLAEVKDARPRWRREAADDASLQYPTETTESVRARPAGLPDSNRRKH